MTFMAALRHDRITAPWFIEGPINGEAFLLYSEKVLVPTLRHGDIVIMDNLGSHKANAVRRAIRAAIPRFFCLPKYSPDLNPIEQFFAKFKHIHWLGNPSCNSAASDRLPRQSLAIGAEWVGIGGCIVIFLDRCHGVAGACEPHGLPSYSQDLAIVSYPIIALRSLPDTLARVAELPKKSALDTLNPTKNAFRPKFLRCQTSGVR
jgi:transposase